MLRTFQMPLVRISVRVAISWQIYKPHMREHASACSEGSGETGHWHVLVRAFTVRTHEEKL